MERGVQFFSISMPYRRLAETFLCILVLSGYLYGAYLQGKYVNTDPVRTDQRAYIRYVERMVESNYEALTTRDRTPLYPFIQSIFYQEASSEQDIFRLGKKINIVIGAICLILLYQFFRIKLPFFSAFNLWLIVTYTCWVFKAAFFHVELLYYTLSFAAFMASIRLFKRKQIWLACLTGVLHGLTYLSKASILPAILWIVVLCLLHSIVSVQWGRDVLAFVKKLKNPTKGGMKALSEICLSIIYPRKIIIPIIVALSFLLTVSVYINNSKQQFGHYFYNVSSTFYVWTDSWEEAKKGTREAKNGDRLEWPDLPKEELPSMKKYWAEHSVKDIVNRMVRGVRFLKRSKGYGGEKYVFLMLLVVSYLVVRYWKVAVSLLSKYRWEACYMLCLLSGYMVLFSFWGGALPGFRRHSLVLFLPFMFCSFLVKHYIGLQMDNKYITVKGYRCSKTVIFNLLLLTFILYDIYTLFTSRIAVQYGGY